MKLLLLRLLQRLRQLFDVNRPSFRHLDCIDLVLENKLLLLISWDTLHASKISIRPGKTVYRKTTGAAICRLPVATEFVSVTLNNVWRSKKMVFPLKRIALDDQTLLFLNEQFLTGLGYCIEQLQPDLTSPNIQLRILHPHILVNIQTRAFNISINQFQLNDYAS